jgi:hypothetical protein
MSRPSCPPRLSAARRALAAALALAAAGARGGVRGTPIGAACVSVCDFSGDPTGVGSGGAFANPWCNVAAGVGGQALSGVTSVAWTTCWSECCSGANCYTGGATSCNVAGASTGAAKVFGAGAAAPSTAFACGAADDATACAALGELYTATGGAGWRDNTGWSDAAAGTTTSLCAFYGVTCDGGGAITQLCACSIAKGSVSPRCSLACVGLLAADRRRWIRCPPDRRWALTDANRPRHRGCCAVRRFFVNNLLVGTIPDSFGSLTTLRTLYARPCTAGGLCANVQAGARVGSCRDRREKRRACRPAAPAASLTVRATRTHASRHCPPCRFLGSCSTLTGGIPGSLGSLTNLVTMCARPAPPGPCRWQPSPRRRVLLTRLTLSICRCPHAATSLLVDESRRYLSSNRLTGAIPDSLGSLTNLQTLYAAGCIRHAGSA